MESGQESGRTDLTAGRGGLLHGALRAAHTGGKSWQDKMLMPRGSRRTPRAGAGAKRPDGAPLRRQFAEAFYLMVMASDLRDRARALGRRYGLEAMELREEILRYIERLVSEHPAQSRAPSPAPSGPAGGGGNGTT